MREILESFEIPIYEKSGYEADDIIGTISKKLPDKNVEVLIHPNLDIPLLGMSVLQKFNIEQRNGEMHLSER